LHCEINLTIVYLEVVLCAPLYKQERPVQRQDCESALGNGPCLDFSHTIPHRSPFANQFSSCASQYRWHSVVPANGNRLLESAFKTVLWWGEWLRTAYANLYAPVDLSNNGDKRPRRKAEDMKGLSGSEQCLSLLVETVPCAWDLDFSSGAQATLALRYRCLYVQLRGGMICDIKITPRSSENSASMALDTLPHGIHYHLQRNACVWCTPSSFRTSG
jgi:hypothetical protein